MFATQPATPEIIAVCKRHRAPELLYIYHELCAAIGTGVKRINNADLAKICLRSEKTAVKKVNILINAGLIKRIQLKFHTFKDAHYYRIVGKNYALSSSSSYTDTPSEIKPNTTQRGKISMMIQRAYPTITNLEFLERAETFSERQITDLLTEAKDGKKKAGWFYKALQKMEPVHLPGAGTTESDKPGSKYISGEFAAWIEH
jgi:hypothetical protein